MARQIEWVVTFAAFRSNAYAGREAVHEDAYVCDGSGSWFVERWDRTQREDGA
jgi:hypothetical protein